MESNNESLKSFYVQRRKDHLFLTLLVELQGSEEPQGDAVTTGKCGSGGRWVLLFGFVAGFNCPAQGPP